MAVENEVVFPRALRDMFPAAAQQLYVESYKQSLAKPAEGTSAELSREGVASRDAWDAVRREYVQDSFTHKWRHISDPAPIRTEKRSIVGTIKSLLKRS